MEQMPVKITVKTTIRNGHEKETYELITFGRYYKKGNSSYLQYEEAMEVGDVKTIVKVCGTEATILRSGAIKMRLPLKMNKSLLGNYETSFVNMAMKTYTTRLHHHFNEEVRKGELDVLYDLTMQGSRAGTYHLQLHFEEEKQ